MVGQSVAAQRASSDDTRVLTRINLQAGVTGAGNLDGNITTAAVVDVETTGLDPQKDRIIELAIRRFRYDDDGIIVEIGECRTWREDPGFPLSEEVKLLTGIFDSDLTGQKIDEPAAIKILTDVDLVIAHNAAFDRPLVERRLSSLPGLPWACSCAEIDWRQAGFEGRALGYLTMQAGWFFNSHRAQGDVDAVVKLLQHEGTNGVPLLYELNWNALSDSHMIEAIGAAYAVKDTLRMRGYRWNAAERLWWREVFDHDLIAEQAWLANEIYAHGRMAQSMGPRITSRTAFDRYR